ncbi:MAG: DUF4194 domain-containing protein [Synergistaceae bacterium]|nr:DUF4194 domain-containing protein [Synergistaceae bacterium]
MDEEPVTTVPPVADRARLARVLAALYRGVLYRDDSEDVWNDMIELQPRVRDHFAAVGLSLFIVEAEGFAYVRYSQSVLEVKDESGCEIPRLVAKRPLTYETSLLLALLRKRLAEFEAGGEGTRLIMTRDEILDMVGIFLPESGNEAKIMDSMEKNINRVKDMGFVRQLKNQANVYEVRGIIKAFVDAEWLGAFEKRLEEYRLMSSLGAISNEE